MDNEKELQEKKLSDLIDRKVYLRIGYTALAVTLIGIAFYFLFRNADLIGGDLRFIGGILGPFIYGAVIAYLLTPVAGKVEAFLAKRLGEEKRGTARGISILIAVLLGIAVIIAVIFLIAPQLVSSIQTLIIRLPGQLQHAYGSIEKMLENYPDIQTELDALYSEASVRLENWLKTGLPGMAEGIVQSVIVGAGSFLNTAKNLFIGMIVAIYILGKRTQLGAQAMMINNALLPDRAAAWLENEVCYADRMFNGFFMGKILDSTIIGLIAWVGCVILRIPSPSLIAVIVGVTNIIPFFGPYLGLIPCALLLLLENPFSCLVFILFDIVLQQLDGNIIGPRILGESTGLSSLWVLFGILFFGGLWGLFGMIVGVPLMAVVYDIVRQLTFFGLRKKGREREIRAYTLIYHPEKEVSKRREKKERKKN